MVSVKTGEVRVAVVVPAYNAARTLHATLASAAAQTTRDIEIIAVDDGSTDDTAEVLQQVAAQEPRLRVIRQPNAGVSAARNRGIAASRARIIALLDADDLWHPEHLARHLTRLDAEPQTDICFSAARFIDAAGRVVGAARPATGPLDAATLLASNPTTTTSTWVVRRGAFDRAGLFDVALRRCEDQAWLVRAALVGLTMRCSWESTVDYRLSSGGLASDLAGMRGGFLAMLERLAIDNASFVDRHRASALASEDLYLARRALQLSLPVAVACRYLAQAFRAAPLHLLATPRATLGVLCRVAARPFKPARPLQPV